MSDWVPTKGNPRGPSRPIPGVQAPFPKPPAPPPVPEPEALPLPWPQPRHVTGESAPIQPGTLSVVEAIWNLPPTMLRYNLESLARQTKTPLEVIVVNGSSDNALAWATADVCARYGGLVRCLNVLLPQFNLSRLFNIGIRASRGEYVMTSSSDQVFSPSFVEEASKVLAPGIILGGMRGELRTASNLGDPDKIAEDWGRVLQRATVPVKWSPGTVICVQRAWWEKVHGYDESRTPYNYCDSDLGSRALADGLVLEVVGWEAAQVLHVWHPYPDLYSKLGGCLPDKRAGLVRNGDNWGMA